MHNFYRTNNEEEFKMKQNMTQFVYHYIHSYNLSELLHTPLPASNQVG